MELAYAPQKIEVTFDAKGDGQLHTLRAENFDVRWSVWPNSFVVEVRLACLRTPENMAAVDRLKSLLESGEQTEFEVKHKGVSRSTMFIVTAISTTTAKGDPLFRLDLGLDPCEIKQLSELPFSIREEDGE